MICNDYGLKDWVLRLMQRQLEMTYIPNRRQDHFFIWCVNSDGRPVQRPPEALLKKLLATGRLDDIEKATVVFDDEDEQIKAHGLFLPMVTVFQMLQTGPNHTLDVTGLRIGKTFDYWQTIAAGLATLIKAGHYYPSLFSVEKEGQHHYFAHWILSRYALNETKTRRIWMANIPPRSLSAADLAPIPVQQWFDVLLDTWTDQIVRHIIAPTYQHVVGDWPEHDLFDDFIPRWFYFLTVPANNSYFTVVEEEATHKNFQKMIAQIHEWHAPLVHADGPDPTASLIQFKENYMSAYITPVTLILTVEPLNPEDPFSDWSQWQLTLRAEGKKRTEHLHIDLKQLLANHPSSYTWAAEKFEQLADLDDAFHRLLHRIMPTDFRAQLSGKTVSNLYTNRDTLQKIGVTLQFPAWLTWEKWTEEKVDVTLNTTVSDEATFSLSSLVQFNWRIAIGDVTIPFAEFKRIVLEQRRFLKHEGQWVELPLEQMREALKEMNELRPSTGRARQKGIMADALRLSITGKQQNRQYVRVELDTAVEQYFTQLHQKPDKNLPIPQSLQGTLRPYQHEGYAWLTHLRHTGIGGCLADDMGLGKTIQAIAYLLNLTKEPHQNPALIVCPTSVIGNWRRELQQFAPTLRVYVHHGPNRYRAPRFAKNRRFFNVMLTSYPLVTKDSDWLLQEEWPALIIDEAQAIKNPATKQSQAIRRLQAQHRLALTGTPMENRLEELWSIMDFLNPGYLGSQQGFRRQFITPIEKHQDQKKLDLLKRLVQPFLLRREKTDRTVIRDLPDKHERKERCPLSKEQAALYQSVVDQLRDKMGASEGIERKGLILATLTKLKQVCNHPSLLTKEPAKQAHSGKLGRFFKLLDPLLAQNQSCLVFTQYVRMGHLLQTFLHERYGKDCPVFFLHGSLPSVRREEMIRQFQEHRGHKAVFILSLKAGGLGLNLTEANHVIHFDRWWNPAVEDQATDRSYRIGQQKDVHVYKLITEGTLEQNIDNLIDKKRHLTEQVIGQGSGWITELTDDEVMELIRLREKVIS